MRTMFAARPARLAALTAGLGLLLGCSSGQPLLSSPAATPTPGPSGLGADLQALFVNGPEGFTRIPDSHARALGYETLNDAIGNDPTAKDRLTADGFQYGFSRGWARPRMPIAAEVAIIKYSAAAGASDIQPYVVGQVPKLAASAGATVAPFTVTVPGAYGVAVNNTAKNSVAYLIYFARSNYHVDIEVDSVLTPVTVEDSPEAMISLANALASQQYAALG